MRGLIRRFAVGIQFWLLRSEEIGEFEGIRLSCLVGGASGKIQFQEILTASLRLLKSVDLNRFNRVRKYLSWVTRTTLHTKGMASYDHATRSCYIDFISPSAVYDVEWLVGWYACVLVHEATHGKIRSLGVEYSPELRARTERLCVKEEQLFLMRLTITQPDLADRLYQEFDASRWAKSWRMTPGEHFRAEMRRIFLPEPPEKDVAKPSD